MLQAGHITNVTFKVNVMGTGAEPKVRLILGTIPELSFAASKGDGEAWGAEVLIPKFIESGSYDMRVEVILNNRLFTPLNKKIEITSDHESIPAVHVPYAEPILTQRDPPEAPSIFQSIVATEEVQILESAKMQTKIEAPKVILKVEAAETPKELSAPAKLSILESFAKKEPKRMYERIVTPLPKPNKVKIEPIKIRISEIDSVTSKIESHVVETTKTTRAQSKSSKSNQLVKLIKEELFYA